MTGNGQASELIDRDRERSLFGRIVQESDSVRLVTISTGRRLGKSSLLEWLESECRRKFGVPAGRAEVKTLENKSPFGLVEYLVPQLRNFGLTFPKFDNLDTSRAAQDFSAFRSQSPMPHGEVLTGGTTVSGGFVANTVDTAIQGGPGGHQTIVQSPQQWTGQQEEIARARCADAFLEDLRNLTENERVLLLVDAYEHSPPMLRQWIETRMLLQHALSGQPTRLIVVLAGTPGEVPDLSAGREQLVQSLSSFSEWEDTHIEKYLKMRGVPLDEMALDMVRRGLRELHWTFDDLESCAQLFKPKQA